MWSARACTTVSSMPRTRGCVATLTRSVCSTSTVIASGDTAAGATTPARSSRLRSSSPAVPRRGSIGNGSRKNGGGVPR